MGSGPTLPCRMFNLFCPSCRASSPWLLPTACRGDGPGACCQVLPGSSGHQRGYPAFRQRERPVCLSLSCVPLQVHQHETLTSSWAGSSCWQWVLCLFLIAWNVALGLRQYQARICITLTVAHTGRVSVLFFTGKLWLDGSQTSPL